MLSRRHNQLGFTFLETIIAISAAAIISGLAVKGYSSYKANLAIAEDVQLFNEALVKARIYIEKHNGTLPASIDEIHDDLPFINNRLERLRSLGVEATTIGDDVLLSLPSEENVRRHILEHLSPTGFVQGNSVVVRHFRIEYDPNGKYYKLSGVDALQGNMAAGGFSIRNVNAINSNSIQATGTSQITGVTADSVTASGNGISARLIESSNGSYEVHSPRFSTLNAQSITTGNVDAGNNPVIAKTFISDGRTLKPSQTVELDRLSASILESDTGSLTTATTTNTTAQTVNASNMSVTGALKGASLTATNINAASASITGALSAKQFTQQSGGTNYTLNPDGASTIGNLSLRDIVVNDTLLAPSISATTISASNTTTNALRGTTLTSNGSTTLSNTTVTTLTANATTSGALTTGTLIANTANLNAAVTAASLNIANNNLTVNGQTTLSGTLNATTALTANRMTIGSNSLQPSGTSTIADVTANVVTLPTKRTGTSCQAGEIAADGLGGVLTCKSGVFALIEAGGGTFEKTESIESGSYYSVISTLYDDDIAELNVRQNQYRSDNLIVILISGYTGHLSQNIGTGAGVGNGVQVLNNQPHQIPFRPALPTGFRVVSCTARAQYPWAGEAVAHHSFSDLNRVTSRKGWVSVFCGNVSSNYFTLKHLSLSLYSSSSWYSGWAHPMYDQPPVELAILAMKQ